MRIRDLRKKELGFEKEQGFEKELGFENFELRSFGYAFILRPDGASENRQDKLDGNCGVGGCGKVKNLKLETQSHSVKFKSGCSLDGFENFGYYRPVKRRCRCETSKG